MDEHAENFLAQWKAGFVLPTLKGGCASAYVTLPFDNEGAEKDWVLSRLEDGVNGRCMSFVIRDKEGEHYECSCVSGLLTHARNLQHLEEQVKEGYDEEDRGRILKYLQLIFPREYERLT